MDSISSKLGRRRSAEAYRGGDVVTEVLGEHRPRCWVSDRWSAQQGHAETHQVCLAHVGEACFAPALRKLLCWAIAVGRRRPTLKDSTLAQYRAKAERRLDRLLAMPTITEAGAEVQRQTKRWRSQFFTFVTDRDGRPPTTLLNARCAPASSSGR